MIVTVIAIVAETTFLHHGLNTIHRLIRLHLIQATNAKLCTLWPGNRENKPFLFITTPMQWEKAWVEFFLYHCQDTLCILCGVKCGLKGLQRKCGLPYCFAIDKIWQLAYKETEYFTTTSRGIFTRKFSCLSSLSFRSPNEETCYNTMQIIMNINVGEWRTQHKSIEANILALHSTKQEISMIKQLLGSHHSTFSPRFRQRNELYQNKEQ